MSILRVRPARMEDLGQIQSMARQTLIGVTSLPDDVARLKRRIELSETSFTSDVAYPGEEEYFFVLEDNTNGELLGCAGIQATCGFRQPFYSFRHDVFIHASPQLDISNKIHALTLCHDLGASSLLNSFHTDERWLDTPAAELISLARLMFVAAHPKRFSERLIAEIVGFSDDQGCSPFWSGLGQHFYGIEYSDAERLDARHDRAFLAELLPHYPIYVPLLPEAAQNVIGQVHPQSRRPYEILAGEGFDSERYVDVYDAGPTLEASTRQIKTITQGHYASLAISTPPPSTRAWLVSNDGLNDFRALLGRFDWEPGQPVPLRAAEAQALDLLDGAPVRIVELFKEPS